MSRYASEHNPLDDLIWSLNKLASIPPSYTAQLLWTLTRDSHQRFDVIKQNFTASGCEAIISFQSDEEDKPQRYRVTVTPLENN